MNEKLTAGQVAQAFGVSIKTVREWDEDGKLPAARTLGGHRRWDRDLGRLVWLKPGWCDTGTAGEPCRGCPDCKAGAAVDIFGEYTHSTDSCGICGADISQDERGTWRHPSGSIFCHEPTDSERYRSAT